jgi:hypothetical protein
VDKLSILHPMGLAAVACSTPVASCTSDLLLRLWKS